MSEDRWLDIEGLFAEAADLAPAERHALLDARCVNDPGLRAELESLLDSHDRAGEFLRVPILTPSAAETALDTVDPPPLATRPGDLIGGRFRLLEQIGTGGMGIVYRAERADGQYDEQVAVKLLASPIPSPEAVRR